jgi:hypothetical protein
LTGKPIRQRNQSQLGKLNARERAQLVIIGYETGLVSPGE